MLRIQGTHLTVKAFKALRKRLQQAYTAGDKRLVRRLSVRLELYPNKKLLLLWDGASYHRDGALRQF
jgi:hypothetical protein